MKANPKPEARLLNVFPFLLSGLLLPLTTFAQNASLITTFTNPAARDSDFFGRSMATLGTDRVLIGGYGDSTTGAGAAYLFRTNGTLLTTFTNSRSTFGFGQPVAFVGIQHVAIGTPVRFGGDFAGAVQLFSTNGMLLTTLTNPNPAYKDLFGMALAPVGAGAILAGAPNDSTAEYHAGAAYLFSTNGALLVTFTSPRVGNNQWFGISLTAVGADRVLIAGGVDGNFVGEAYLFSTNGTLLTTFTNPTPATNDRFGWALAAMGSDRVIIGALFDDLSAIDAGAAYLFSTNGALLTTFTNPAPAESDCFGASVAAAPNHGLLIGAYQDDSGAINTGTIYLFSTNGTLLTIITNPAPQANDCFGMSLATFGNHVLVSAPWNDSGAIDAGAAYLFRLASTFSLSSPSWEGTNFSFTLQTVGQLSYTVEYNDDLNTTNWLFLRTVLSDGSLMPIVVPMTNDARFFRVRQP